MAKLNIIDAETLVDKELSKAEVDFILAAREGVALSDVDEDIFRDLYERELVEVINFSHPRARNSIKGVVVTEDGVKITNVIDSRAWAKAETHISQDPVEAEDNANVETIVKAQNLDKAKGAKREDIDADSPVNKDYKNKA